MDQSQADRVIKLACEIQQIPAPTFAEAKRADLIQQRFVAEGLLQVSMDSLGNVYGRIPGKADLPPLIVSAHLDTVFPEDTNLTLRYTPDQIFGPGIGDNSLGVAALFGLIWGLPDMPRDVWLVANVCEEGLGNLRGIKAVVDRFGRDVLAYIVVEGMSLGQVYHAGLGVQRYRIAVHTHGGHAWVDYGKPSAIHELARLIVELNRIPLPEKPRTSLNVGVIRGGTSINTIAAEANLELDLRSEDSQTLSELANKVESLAKTIHGVTDDVVQIKADVIGQRPAGSIAIDHPLVRLAVGCLEEQRLTAHLNIGSTDANCPLSYGIPAICVGITSGGGAHTIDEYINIRPIAMGLQQLVSLVTQACNTSG